MSLHLTRIMRVRSFGLHYLLLFWSNSRIRNHNLTSRENMAMHMHGCPLTVIPMWAPTWFHIRTNVWRRDFDCLQSPIWFSFDISLCSCQVYCLRFSEFYRNYRLAYKALGPFANLKWNPNYNWLQLEWHAPQIYISLKGLGFKPKINPYHLILQFD